MRITIAAAALTLTIVAACSDATSTTALRPQSASLDKEAKITICHAAGQAGTTHFNTLNVSGNAYSAHFDAHGTPQAGHELDYMGPCRTEEPPPPQTGTLSVCTINGTLNGDFSATPVTFNVPGGTPSSFSKSVPASGAAATCQAVTVNAGAVTVTQVGQPGFWVSALTSSDPGATLDAVPSAAGSDVAGTVNVAVGGTTTITFTERK